MARPRVFISSTFYGLRHVRADIEAFVRDVGYDAVANERGEVPYGSETALEEYCYKEIENCDIVVSIVGGRFGSESVQGSHSISQMEVKQAVALGRQLYVFVDADVLAELRTYKLNTQNREIKYAHADDIRIFEFLEEVERLKRNNTIFAFRESAEIVAILREQWAGTFQRMLRSSARQDEIRMIESLKSTAQSLEELVKYLTSKADRGDTMVAEILLPSHPVFQAIAKVLDIPYRVYFQNFEEMSRWLATRNYKHDSFESGHDWSVFTKNGVEFTSLRKGTQKWDVTSTLEVSTELFAENGDLKVMASSNWDDSLLRFSSTRSKASTLGGDFDDEIPF